MAEEGRKSYLEHAALERISADFKRSEVYWVARWLCIGTLAFLGFAAVFMFGGTLALEREKVDLRARLRELHQDSEKELKGIVEGARRDTATQRDDLSRHVESFRTTQTELLAAARAQVDQANKTIEQQEKTLEARRKTLQAEETAYFERRQKELTAQADEIAKKLKGMEDSVAVGLSTVRESIKDFQSSQDRLRERAVNEVVAGLNASLQAGGNDLTKRIQDAQTKLSTIERFAADLDARLFVLRRILDENQNLDKRVGAIKSEIDLVLTYSSQALQAKKSAEESQHEAKYAERAIRASLEANDTRVKKLDTDVGELQGEKDKLAQRISRIKEDLPNPETVGDGLARKIDSLRTSLCQDIEQLRRQIPPRAYPSCTTSADSCREVQLALNKAINAGLVVDGAAGTNTRNAILKFQEHIGARQTGTLSPSDNAKLFPDAQGPAPALLCSAPVVDRPAGGQ